MKEAEDVFGTHVPRIDYIPPGYKINDTSLVSDNKLHVTYKNQSNDTIVIEYLWNSKRVLPYKIDTSAVTVELNGSLAQLEEYDQENVLIWNLIPENDQESLYILKLRTPKSLEISGMIEIAQSIR